MPNNFSAEAHFESKIKQGSIKNQSSVIRFENQLFEPKKTTVEKGLKRICKDQFKYSDFLEINQLHSEYLHKIKEISGNKGFLDNVLKAELTGAKIKISNKIGFVVEERKNSLVVIFEDDRTKIFPKKVWDFILMFDKSEYKFFSKKLKKSRIIG